MRAWAEQLVDCRAHLRHVGVEEQRAEAARQARQQWADLQRVESSMFSGQRDEQQVANAMKDPEIQQILQDPMINNVLKNLQENPQAAQDALKDPVIAERLQKLAAAGIISFG